MPKRRKGFLCAAGILLCASFFMNSMTQDKVASAAATGEVNVNGYLNVRKGPGKSYGLVKSGGTRVTLSDGKIVSITAKSGKWYHVKFKQNGKSINGYLHSDYMKVQTGNVRTSIGGKISVTTAKLYKKVETKRQVLKINGKAVKLSKNTAVKITSEKLVGKQKWYYVSFQQNSRKYKGYVRAKYVRAVYKKGMPGIVKSSKTETLYKTAGKKTAVKAGGVKVILNNKKQVTVLNEKTVSGAKYYRVKLRFRKKSVKGYLRESVMFFQIVKSEKTKTENSTSEGDKTISGSTGDGGWTDNSSLTDEEFQKKLQTEGFPASYITPLVQLHQKYPSWDFKAYKTGLDWNTVIKNESKVGLNLLSNSKSYAWKSLASGAYDWKTDKFIPYDGSTWVTASEMAVKYYMDPRNFLDERGIFQFESLAYQENIQSQAGVENILRNTPMYSTDFTYPDSAGKQIAVKYSKAFMDAAALSQVSPYHLAARVKQEVVVSPTAMSSSVSGNVSGYQGIYNFYNIGANNSTVPGGAVANGLNWASSGTSYSRPWNNRYRSITGGASFIGRNYINVGQNTLYLQKFNVTSNNRYNHQYMANVEAPNSEATKTMSAYGTNMENMPMVFSIPVYSGMPAGRCEVPSGGKNPNNYLKTLYVKNHPFTSKFVLGDDGSKTYKLTVANSVKSIKICATKVSSEATLTGTGTKSLSVGTKTYKVKVKSASGNTRTYKIQVTRK